MHRAKFWAQGGKTSDGLDYRRTCRKNLDPVPVRLCADGGGRRRGTGGSGYNSIMVGFKGDLGTSGPGEGVGLLRDRGRPITNCPDLQNSTRVQP